MIKAPTLWHYTATAFVVLGRAGELHPAIHLASPKDLRSPHSRAHNMSQQLVWLTDLEELDCAALRLPLGQVYHQYQVIKDGAPVLPWSMVRKEWPKDVVRELESSGTQPEHWFVSRGPVPVIHSSYDYC